MIIYTSADQYIETCTTIKAKIVAVDAIIAALTVSAASAASKDGLQEYWLDDGQTKIKTIYKGVDQIFSSIWSFQRLKNLYLSQLNGGRIVRLVDGKNLQG